MALARSSDVRPQAEPGRAAASSAAELDVAGFTWFTKAFLLKAMNQVKGLGGELIH
jgi:hypothetical protein